MRALMKKLLCVAGLLAVAYSTQAQQVGANTGPAAGKAVGTEGVSRVTGTTSPWGTPATTNNNPNNNSGSVDTTRTMFFTGNVMFDDGTPPNSDIRIERVCSGATRVEAHTDTKGYFSFQLDGDLGSSIADADASSNSYGTARSATNGLNDPGTGMGRRSLLGCELKAVYPGYVSETIDLSMRHSMDDPKVGTILLHHLGNVKGTTISLTTAQAPKSAQKSYEKGMQLAQKGKFEEAEQKFIAATTNYPKFAAAWFVLGEVRQKLNHPAQAKTAYLAAIAADPHYVSPYDQLARAAAEQKQWEEAAHYSRQATDLNPVEFPSSFWYNAVANYQLNKRTEAEKSAQALVKLDSKHIYPQAETMLAELAEDRGDLEGAEAHLKAYLAEVPLDSKGATAFKGQLTRIEEARATR
jgi:tetratricopeptide (TPR) repeat protein